MRAEKIAIITDSTCELTVPQLKEYDLHAVPLKVCFGTEEFWDREEISPEQFYQKLNSSKIFPRTLHPTSKRFYELYQKLEDQGYTHIVCILISSGISKTVEAAEFASHMVTNSKIEIIDSRGTSFGLAFLSMYGRTLIRQGKTFDEIIYKIKSKIPTMLHLFSVDNLTALERGGRIGKASAFVGNLLGVRPILGFNIANGKIEMLSKVSSTQAANESLATLVSEHVKKHGLVQGVAIMNGNVPEICAALKQTLVQKGINASQIVDARIGAVIGSHLGSLGWGIIAC